MYDPAYTSEVHRHRFAVWTASLAAKRRLADGKVAKFRAALDATNIADEIGVIAKRGSTAQEYDEEHTHWCERYRKEFNTLPVQLPKGGEPYKDPTGMSFGQAAKFLNVYIKCVFIIPDGAAHTDFRYVAHPPIDSFVLKGAGYTGPMEWTRWSPEEYRQAVAYLRSRLGSQDEFWMIETHWNGEN